jgi:hypothetical protein
MCRAMLTRSSTASSASSLARRFFSAVLLPASLSSCRRLMT